MSRALLGPVHVNLQFRENLAPEAGPIRGDNRVDSISRFNPRRYTNVPGFSRWARNGMPWQQSYNRGAYKSSSTIDPAAVKDVAKLIMDSKRGIIVVGNVRTTGDGPNNQSCSADVISHFAQSVGFPVFAGAMSGSLRNGDHTAIVSCAEHLLKNPQLSKNMRPDLILQIGAPLVSTEVSNVMRSAMMGNDGTNANVRGHEDSEEHVFGQNEEYFNGESGKQNSDSFENSAFHVLIHPHATFERADPDFTATHIVSASAAEFLTAVLSELDQLTKGNIESISSELAPLVLAGRALRSAMTDIIHEASSTVSKKAQMTAENSGTLIGEKEFPLLTEPQIILAISEVMEEEEMFQSSLFLSNSMPVRDAEFFMYPSQKRKSFGRGPACVGVNRGASGIDGIISAATGFLDGNSFSNQSPRISEDKVTSGTTLLIGDLASLHDINALHGISREQILGDDSSPSSHPSLTTVVVNNNGGGIFSFLPVSRFGNQVGFEEFFGTATDSFSFEKGAAAFGLPYSSASTYQEFKEAYRRSILTGSANLLEAKVVGRTMNVEVHAEISKRAIKFVDDLLKVKSKETLNTNLPFDTYVGSEISEEITCLQEQQKTVLLLHGWMGDKSEWRETATVMTENLPPNYRLLALDLPGHGETELMHSSTSQMLRKSLNLDESYERKSEIYPDLSIDDIAHSVLNFLKGSNITRVDSICGYSLGGRVALAMNRICYSSNDEETSSILDNVNILLLSSNPGIVNKSNAQPDTDENRINKDDLLARMILRTSLRSYLQCPSSPDQQLTWAPFLMKWYGAGLWGNLQAVDSSAYREMLRRRMHHLSIRGPDLASILRSCSPPINTSLDWKYVDPGKTLFISGKLDKKYSTLGKEWKNAQIGLTNTILPNVGHALLVENPAEVAKLMTSFIVGERLNDVIDSNLLENIKTKNVDFNKEEAPATIMSSNNYKDEKSTKVDNSIKTTRKDMLDVSVKQSTKYNEEVSPKDASVLVMIGTLDFEIFSIDIVTDGGNTKGATGMGWGASSFDEKTRLNQRMGYVLQIDSYDGSMIGVGEISPLPGLHLESFEEAGEQLRKLQQVFASEEVVLPTLHARYILSLDGSLSNYIDQIAAQCGFVHNGKVTLMSSVRSGLEMSILALASQAVRQPLPLAITSNYPEKMSERELKTSSTLSLNGLITRGASISSFQDRISQVRAESRNNAISYPSLKVKVGHQTIQKDAQAILEAGACAKVRADANRAWNISSAIEFASALNELGIGGSEQIEFIEEPIQKVFSKNNSESNSTWVFVNQLKELEYWYEQTGIFYALDESVADLAVLCDNDFDSISRILYEASEQTSLRGCAAFVLKPAILGLELSLQIARFARQELDISAVFSSSFDSGVGLAYCAFIAASANVIPSTSTVNIKLSHGLGTFEMLGGDTLTPSFGSYVNERGVLNVASLARALYGLGLDEMRETLPIDSSVETDGTNMIPLCPQQIIDYQSSSSKSSSGREINVQVSLPLPFSDARASSTFTDLPQQSRWSPWLTSVEYIPTDGETEWTLNVRGFEFRWRAKSTILDSPKGIAWESVSGLKNRGEP